MHAIFCHIPNTAGTSIVGALRPIARQGIIRFGDTHESAQLRLDRLIETLGRENGQREWASLFRFTIIRNPWSRLVTLYHNNAFRNALGEYADSTFGAWVHAGLPFDHSEFDNLFSDQDGRRYLDQDAFFCDSDGHSLVEFVGTFEHLQRDWQLICRRLDLGNVHLPHYNRGEHEHYSSYYTPEIKNLVAERFGEFIERYKYTF